VIFLWAQLVLDWGFGTRVEFKSIQVTNAL